MNSHSLTPKLTDWAHEIRTEIELSWGEPASVWLRESDGSWSALTNYNLPANLDVAATLEKSQAGTGYSLNQCDNGNFALSLNLGLHQGKRLAAIGLFPNQPQALMSLIARLTQNKILSHTELNQSRCQLTAYASQVTRDLEELSWLRSLVKQIELKDERNSIQDAARSILPSLRDMIRAEQVLLISAQQDRSSVGEVTFSVGESSCDKRTAIEVVHHFRKSARRQSVVRNGEATEFESVQALVLCPIATSTFMYGWLLVINRSKSLGFFDYIIDHYNSVEFGTCQESLTASAAAALATHARNSKLINERSNLLTGVIRSMVNAIDAKDSYTCGHSDRVALLSKHLAQTVGMSPRDCQRIYMTGLLHDIGKIGVPDSILQNPAKLTDEEFDAIKAHPQIGYEILQHVPQLQYALPGVLHHHESIDGTGYPHGLVGNKIPFTARILAVADAYDAMTSNRPYRDGMPRERAEHILRENAGSQWDAEIVNHFLNNLGPVHRICFSDTRYNDARSNLIAQYANSRQ